MPLLVVMVMVDCLPNAVYQLRRALRAVGWMRLFGVACPGLYGCERLFVTARKNVVASGNISAASRNAAPWSRPRRVRNLASRMRGAHF